MADSTLDNLPAATLPLGLTDRLLVSQAGVPRRVSLQGVLDSIPDEGGTTVMADLGTGGRWEAHAVSALVTLNGASATIASMIPPRSIIKCVAVRVISTLTGGLTGFDVGYTGGSQSAFGGGIGVGAGSTNIGVVGPFAVYSPTGITLTALGGTGSGNTDKVRVVAYFETFTAPTA